METFLSQSSIKVIRRQLTSTQTARPHLRVGVNGQRFDVNGDASNDTAFFANVGAGAQGYRLHCSGKTEIGWDVGNSKPKTIFNEDGSATFAGQVNAAKFAGASFVRAGFGGQGITSQTVNGSPGTLCIVPTNEGGTLEANKVALGSDAYPWFAIKATSTRTGSLLLEN